LRKIAETYATSNKKIGVNYATCAIDSLIDYKIDVLRFAWKTSKTIVLKRNGKTVNVSRKDENFIAPDRKDVGQLSKTLDTWFEGSLLLAPMLFTTTKSAKT
jgi:type V secretory pathway adhesin AidA